MKKLAKSVLMLSMASLAVLSSCKKEEDNAEVTDVTVTISPSPSASVLQIGSVLTLTIEATGNPDNQVTEILVTSSQSNGALLNFTDKGTSFTKVVRDTITQANATYTYTVTVKGEKGNPATKSYTVQSVPEYGFIDRTPSLITLVSQTNVNGYKFMQLTGDLTLFDIGDFDANKSNVDIAFFYGTNSGFKHSLSAPQDTFLQNQVFSGLDFTGTNTTKLTKTNLTPAQFEALASYPNDSIMMSYVASNPVSGWNKMRVDNLAVGNVLAYKTASGKIGFIRVATLGGSAGGDASIEMDIAYQR